MKEWRNIYKKKKGVSYKLAGGECYYTSEYVKWLEQKLTLRAKNNDVLDLVIESFTKCWNCKQFTQTGTNTSGNEVGKCKLNNCAVDFPKWQKCPDFDQCGNFR